jgi:signal transduction histidine kinase
MRMRARWGGLRSKVTLAFALGALTLSAALALGTYFSARHLLIEQRERTATRQAYADAALVRDSLLTPGTEISDVLGALSPPAGAVIYVRRNGTWYSSSLESAGTDSTAEVRRTVVDGSVGVGWTETTSPNAVVVGVPLHAVDAEYYEVTAADELDRTLWTLQVALWISAALTTVAGALLGRAASRRVLAPLHRVTAAAARISAGDVTTRLRDTADPDLAALVGAFNNMVDTVRDRIERDARFAADVAHELRTPVTTMTTSLSLLENAADLSPRTRQAVQLMVDELTRLGRALEDLLALGRLDAGAQEGPRSLTTAPDLARQALRTTGRSTDLLTVDARGSAEPVVVVDRPQMLRALANLMRNADLHGGGLTRVEVVGGDTSVDIRIEDAGPGVPLEERSRIFERFARAGGAKAGTGSGLGLSIVEQTVRQHRGDVRCTDRPGGGAVFTITLPTAATTAPEAS